MSYLNEITFNICKNVLYCINVGIYAYWTGSIQPYNEVNKGALIAVANEIPKNIKRNVKFKFRQHMGGMKRKFDERLVILKTMLEVENRTD